MLSPVQAATTTGGAARAGADPREHFGADPAVRAAFMERARVDRAADVRLAAIRALADGLATDVDGATALGEVACTDADTSVRLEAVKTLVTRIGLDEAVCGVLQRVIREDSDAGVRMEAGRRGRPARRRPGAPAGWRGKADRTPSARGGDARGRAHGTAGRGRAAVDSPATTPTGGLRGGGRRRGRRHPQVTRTGGRPIPRALREPAVRACGPVPGASARDADRPRTLDTDTSLAEAVIALATIARSDAELCAC